MRKLLAALLFICCYVTVNAQEKDDKLFTIKGTVFDKETNLPLEYATAIVKNTLTDKVLFGAITNKNGDFNLDVPKGDYQVNIEFLSYKTSIINLKDVITNVNLGKIILEVNAELLDDIEITAEKRNLEFQQNKLVVNVAKDIAAQSSMTLDILNNIPSVTVVNDNIQLRGQNATVMINGKTSSMSNTEALKSLPANSIEKIEVIAHPGAQYKASYTSIINIILKKGKDIGLNAAITGSVGYYDIYGGALYLNHKSKSVNFFTNISYFHKNQIRLSDAKNEYFSNNSTTSFLNEKSEFNSINNGLISRIGADFYLTKATTLTASINYNNLDYKRNTQTNSTIINDVNVVTSTNNREHLSNFDNELLEYMLEFEHLFRKEGRKLTSYITSTNDTDSFANTINNDNIDYTDEAFTENNKLQNIIFDIQYTNPISEKTNYTIGYNGEFGKIPFKYINTTLQNHIDYTEDVHAAFITFNYQGDKVMYDLGLRGEFSKTAIDYKTLNVVQNKEYNDFLPSLYLEYAINDNQSTSIGYNRKILRPGYKQLHPFEEKFSETSSYKGNEDLNLIYLDSYKLDYAFFGEKITFIPTLFYDKYKDYWQGVTFETGEQINGVNKLLTTIANVGHVDYYGLDLTVQLKASKNLDFTFSSLLYNFDQKGVFETTNTLNEPIKLDYNHNSFNGNFKFLTQLKIPNVFDFQTNIIHFLESEGAYSIRKAYTFASATISKDLFNKNATISLTTNDIFNSSKTKRDRFDTNYFSKTLIENKYQDIILSFTYRINQSKKDRKIDFDKKDKKPNY